MKTLAGAMLYPGLGIAEATNLSVGRGTDHPFEMYGAPYCDSRKLVENLSKKSTPGVHFVECSFTPKAKGHPFLDELCHGVTVVIDDRETLEPILAGLHLIQALHETHPNEFYPTKAFATLVGDPGTWKLLCEEGCKPEEIEERWRPRLEEFKRVREKHLLYP
jgi:uncharacterized protein YbbC (DUF1343 family)